MRHWLIGVLGLFGLFGLGLHLRAASNPTGRIDLEMRDSRTGRATSGYFQIRDLQSGDQRAVETDQSGRASLDLPTGKFMVSVNAKGHEDSHASTEVMLSNSTAMTFHLDPTLEPWQLEPQRVRAQRLDGRFFVQGFVSSPTGAPAVGAQVKVGVTTVNCDNEGYFEALVPAAGQVLDLTISHSKFGSVIHKNLEVWSGGDVAVRERLPALGETSVIDEAAVRNHQIAKENKGEPCSDCTQEENYTDPGDGVSDDFADAPALPQNLRVGRNCPTATTCTTVEIYSVDTYVKGVLPSEWYSCWGNVTGGMNCLKAGAVAVRSYGVYHAYNPRTSTYDICDTTSCQVFGNTTNSNTNTAVDQTTRYVLLTSAGAIARSEYSAENNNAGCGDGFSGTGTSGAPCISDGVCTGFATFGHGRGLCQWGSARWATGKRLTSSQSCTNSAPNHGFGTKDWLQILAHYYPIYTLTQGVSPLLITMSYSNSALRGYDHNLTFTASSQGPRSGVILGASLQPTGGGTVYSDAAHDEVVSILPGTNPYQRLFSIANSQPTGLYDVLGTLYFDRNNSGTINAGDFVLSSRTQVSSLTVQVGTTLSTASFRMIKANRATPISATLKQLPTNAGISARTITFKLNGDTIGTAVTNPLGIATLNYTPAPGTPSGPNLLTCEFASVNGYQAASATGKLQIVLNP